MVVVEDKVMDHLCMATVEGEDATTAGGLDDTVSREADRLVLALMRDQVVGRRGLGVDRA